MVNAGKTPVRAIALSISTIPVAAPAPGHDPRRHLMTAASRAHEKTRRVRLTRTGRRCCRLSAFKATLYLTELCECRLRGCGARPGEDCSALEPIMQVCAGVFRKWACPKPWSRNQWSLMR